MFIKRYVMPRYSIYTSNFLKILMKANKIKATFKSTIFYLMNTSSGYKTLGNSFDFDVICKNECVYNILVDISNVFDWEELWVCMTPLLEVMNRKLASLIDIPGALCLQPHTSCRYFLSLPALYIYVRAELRVSLYRLKQLNHTFASLIE